MPTESKKGSDERERSDTREGEVADDQKERRYYYDDAHGYEDFDPDSADEDEEAD